MSLEASASPLQVGFCIFERGMAVSWLRGSGAIKPLALWASMGVGESNYFPRNLMIGKPKEAYDSRSSVENQREVCKDPSHIVQPSVPGPGGYPGVPFLGGGERGTLLGNKQVNKRSHNGLGRNL